jgi:hypothetical protein
MGFCEVYKGSNLGGTWGLLFLGLEFTHIVLLRFINFHPNWEELIILGFKVWVSLQYDEPLQV